MYLFYSLVALIIGFCLDFILGDPHGMWHPVCSIGNLIHRLDIKLRKATDTKKKQFWKGVVLVGVVCGITTGITLLILYISYRLHVIWGILIEAVMCYQILATKSLKDESMKVSQALQEQDIEKARDAVSMIVGRDTTCLDEKGITKAAVETIAENTSDGCIAPMFYMMIGGAVLGFFYKAVNTMDSMVGYKNDTYLYFGRAAAKFDDFVNYLPARISAWLMIASAFCLRLDRKQAKKIYKRDRYNHASPNSANTEAVVAGALNVQLAGDAYYFGTLVKKKTIGDDIRPIEVEDIGRTNQMLYVTAILGVVLVALLKGSMLLFWL